MYTHTHTHTHIHTHLITPSLPLPFVTISSLSCAFVTSYVLLYIQLVTLLYTFSTGSVSPTSRHWAPPSFLPLYPPVSLLLSTSLSNSYRDEVSFPTCVYYSWYLRPSCSSSDAFLHFPSCSYYRRLLLPLHCLPAALVSCLLILPSLSWSLPNPSCPNHISQLILRYFHFPSPPQHSSSHSVRLVAFPFLTNISTSPDTSSCSRHLCVVLMYFVSLPL